MKKYKAPPPKRPYEPTSPIVQRHYEPTSPPFAAQYIPTSPGPTRKKRKNPPSQVIVFARSLTGNSSGVKERKPPPKAWKYPALEERTRHRKKQASAFVRDAKITLEAPAPPSTACCSKPLDQLADRQTPLKLADLVGQSRAIEGIRKWFQRFNDRDGELPRALLLVGPSGTGKSISARLAMQEMEHKIYAYSPDDMVGKISVLSERGIGEVIFKLAIRSTVFEKFGIILEDVGAIKKDAQKALAEVISGQRYFQQFQKKWQAPFILTCDSNDMAKIVALSRECEVINFVHPSQEDLLRYCNTVCEKEQLVISAQTRENAVEGCGGDVRRLLNTLQFLAIQGAAGSGSAVDCATVFYNQQNNKELLRTFLRSTHKLPQLADLMEAHPVAMEMLLAENYPNLCKPDALANVSNHLSICDGFDAFVYDGLHWELQECATTLATWGTSKMLAFENQPLAKSAFFGWKQKEVYRKKLIANVTLIPERGTDFIDYGIALSERIQKHTAKDPETAFVQNLKDLRYTYGDLQDVWKASHLGESTLPTLRGKQSLRKLLA